MSERVVIIGAGGSGRGFLARLLQADGAALCFVDQDERLIRALQKNGCYRIQVGEQTPRTVIRDYEAFPVSSEAAIQRVAETDWVFTSVGEEHLAELAPFLKQASQKRGERSLPVIACENGIAPKVTLRKALGESAEQNILVTQGVIFCTSIPVSNGSLDILSEDYSEQPYDVDEALFQMPFAHFPATRNFAQLLQRKIYTYNCLSACIAYLGAYLGYTVYSQAANDPQVRRYCDHLSVGLNRALCKNMGTAPEEQKAFAEQALKKFSNPADFPTRENNPLLFQSDLDFTTSVDFAAFIENGFHSILKFGFSGSPC
nr:2-dehydropantoate 2-reductase N-terminal domain-containing protein [Marasmitruncus massiliensis]